LTLLPGLAGGNHAGLVAIPLDLATVGNVHGGTPITVMDSGTALTANANGGSSGKKWHHIYGSKIRLMICGPKNVDLYSTEWEEGGREG
jgi:hypothetical protein